MDVPIYVQHSWKITSNSQIEDRMRWKSTCTLTLFGGFSYLIELKLSIDSKNVGGGNGVKISHPVNTAFDPLFCAP